MSADGYSLFPGGKGFNQTIALARCGADVYHAGKIGADGNWLVEYLQKNNVNTDLIDISSEPTGHAIIQVVPSGENAITIFGGANITLKMEFIDRVLSQLNPGEYLLLQNEINDVDQIIKTCKDRKINIVFNPAPFTEDVADYQLESVNTLILNQVEAAGLSGESDEKKAIVHLRDKYPQTDIILTLGSQGVLYNGEAGKFELPALKVQAVDTTAAGDTFIGFYLGEILAGKAIEQALNSAIRAAAICVTRNGAASSIPEYGEL